MCCVPQMLLDLYLPHIQHLLPDTWKEVENVNMLICTSEIVSMLILLKMS